MNNLFCISPKALCTTLTLLFLPLIIIYQGHGLCEPSCSSQSYRSILSTNHKVALYTEKSPVYINGFSHLPLHFEILYPSTFLGCSLFCWWLVSLACSLICSALFLHIVLYASFQVIAVHLLTCFWKVVILGLSFGDMPTRLRYITTNQGFIFSYFYLYCTPFSAAL